MVSKWYGTMAFNQEYTTEIICEERKSFLKMPTSVFTSEKPDQNLLEKSSGSYMLNCVH